MQLHHMALGLGIAWLMDEIYGRRMRLVATDYGARLLLVPWTMLNAN